jgi:ribosomal protein S18 acetylase RimI-like enzyme
MAIQIINDPDKSLEVMHRVGTWMQDSGLNPSQWWQPQNMNSEFMFQHSEPEEFFALLVDGQPAASMVLQETERNQSWKVVDGDSPQKALYVHWLCVDREFAGQGLPQKLIMFAKEEAQKKGFKQLRLDTNSEEKKLCELYERLGFKKVGIDPEGDHKAAYYEMDLKS